MVVRDRVRGEDVTGVDRGLPSDLYVSELLTPVGTQHTDRAGVGSYQGDGAGVELALLPVRGFSLNVWIPARSKGHRRLSASSRFGIPTKTRY